MLVDGKIAEGAAATAYGWVQSIREQKTITFVILMENREPLQLVIKDKRLARKVKVHASIMVKGRVAMTERAPRGYEIHVEEISVLNKPRKIPPFDIMAKEEPSIDVRLDYRPVDLRRPSSMAVFKIRARALQLFREYLVNNGFIEVNTPKIIATASEGGSALFPVMYYDRQAFLAQSPQLYKEELTMAFERVFEIGPIFRAEQSRTMKHLSEATSLDVEAAFLSNEEIMDLIEGMVKHVIKGLNSEPQLFAALKAKPPALPERFPRFTYSEIIEKLKGLGEDIAFGDDLTQKSLEEFGNMAGGFYFITEWPAKLKPFYIMPKENGLTSSFDLMYMGLELASGGQRIHDPVMLRKSIKEHGLPVSSFKFHITPYYYGMPPHGGFGLGVDRFIMVLTDRKNIREVVLYPRDLRRLVP